MTTEVLARSVTAAVATYFGQGRIWYLKAATGPVTIVCRKSGQGSTTVRSFINVAAGFKFKADLGDGWDILELTSASTQNIEMILGDDDVEVSNAVTVNGSVSTAETPASAFTDKPSVTVNTAQIALFAANLSRKRITVLSNPLNTDNVSLRSSGGANTIYVLQPGTGYTFANTAAMDAISGTAGQQILLCEES